MLSYIQSDILNLRNRGAANEHDQSKTGPSLASYPEEPIAVKNWDTDPVSSLKSPSSELGKHPSRYHPLPVGKLLNSL